MPAPKIPSLFKLPKTRTFGYKPMYYDAIKEAVAEREAQIEKEETLKEKLGTKEYALREQMLEKWGQRSIARHRQSSNRRLIFIIGLLAIVAYYFFYK